MKLSKKLISILLSVLMLLSAIPLSGITALASEYSVYLQSIQNNTEGKILSVGDRGTFEIASGGSATVGSIANGSTQTVFCIYTEEYVDFAACTTAYYNADSKLGTGDMQINTCEFGDYHYKVTFTASNKWCTKLTLAGGTAESQPSSVDAPDFYTGVNNSAVYINTLNNNTDSKMLSIGDKGTFEIGPGESVKIGSAATNSYQRVLSIYTVDFPDFSNVLINNSIYYNGTSLTTTQLRIERCLFGDYNYKITFTSDNKFCNTITFNKEATESEGITTTDAPDFYTGINDSYIWMNTLINNTENKMLSVGERGTFEIGPGESVKIGSNQTSGPQAVYSIYTVDYPDFSNVLVDNSYFYNGTSLLSTDLRIQKCDFGNYTYKITFAVGEKWCTSITINAVTTESPYVTETDPPDFSSGITNQSIYIDHIINNTDNKMLSIGELGEIEVAPYSKVKIGSTASNSYARTVWAIYSVDYIDPSRLLINNSRFTSVSNANQLLLTQVKIEPVEYGEYNYKITFDTNGRWCENITFYEGVDPNAPQPTDDPDDGYNLTLDDGIEVNFLIDTPFYDTEDGFITYNYITDIDTENAAREGGRIDVEELTTYTSGDVYNGDRKLTLKAAPAQIAEDFVVKVYAKDADPTKDEPVSQYTVSIEDYCTTIINNADKYEEKTVNLAKSILNYGQLANEYFGYATKHAEVNSTDEPYVVTTVGDYQADLTEAELNDIRSKASASIVNQGSVAIRGVTYITQMDPEFRFYLGTDVTEAQAAAMTLTVSEGLQARMINTKWGICVSVTGLKSNEFGRVFSLTVGDTTINYNGYAYLASVFKDGTNNSSQLLKNLAKGIYRYSVACNEAFA